MGRERGKSLAKLIGRALQVKATASILVRQIQSLWDHINSCDHRRALKFS